MDHELMSVIQFESFLILSTRTSLHVSFKYILISLTSFLGVPHSVRIFYDTSLLTEPFTILKAVNN